MMLTDKLVLQASHMVDDCSLIHMYKSAHLRGARSGRTQVDLLHIMAFFWDIGQQLAVTGASSGLALQNSLYMTLSYQNSCSRMNHKSVV